MSETLITTAENTNQAEVSEPAAALPATAADQGDQTQQSPVTQSDDATQANAEESPTGGAPENYEFKAIEGAEVGDEVLAAYSDAAKELNLPQDAAQKMLDKMAPALASRQTAQFEAAKTQWAEAARTDKEFGGEKLDASLATARKAIDAFGSPELKALLNDSGLGNHPDVIRFMVRAGATVSEDSFVSGNSGGGEEKTVAQRMYPGMNP